MKNTYRKVLMIIAYTSMIVVNFLANSLPINNRSTGEISDAYPNLFTPAGFTFSIWGLIYLLLAGYICYQFSKNSEKTVILFHRINPLFIGTSIANIAWIFAWHYDYIGVSVLIMAALLYLLIKIANILRIEEFTFSEKLFILTPFSVYFGWITIATIANITVFLVSINWNGFGIADYIWTSIVLFAGVIIGVLRMSKDRNIPYGLVLIWAYLGILLKHLSLTGFNSEYPVVIATLAVCLIVFILFIVKLFLQKAE